MKTRIVKTTYAAGNCQYKVQYKEWYWPFWATWDSEWSEKEAMFRLNRLRQYLLESKKVKTEVIQ